MALTQICMCECDKKFPAVRGNSFNSESIAPVVGNTQTTIAAPNPEQRPSTLQVLDYGAYITTDTDIYFAVGDSPDATTATGRMMLPAGAQSPFIILSPGEKVAVCLV